MMSRRSAKDLLQLDFPTRAEDYELIKQIGTGGSATVWQARCKPQGTVMAVKRVNLEALQEKSLNTLIREAQTMAGLQHENVLNLHCSFIAAQDLWLVMPYIAGGNLSQLLHSQYKDGMEEELIISIARDILRGLDYLHRHELAHRDLKADNLLVDESGRVLLADFGATAQLERTEYAPEAVGLAASPRPGAGGSPSASASGSDRDASVHRDISVHSNNSDMVPQRTSSSWSKYLSRKTFVGTPYAMAPEVMLESDEGYSQSADIWSFGIVLLELARGRAPLAHCAFTKIILDTVHGPAPRLEPSGSGEPQKFSKALCNFVSRCLNKDADSRPTATELLKDPIFKAAHDHKWVAKRLLSGKAGKRVAFSEDGSPLSNTHSPQHSASSHRSMFSRHSSKSLQPGEGSGTHQAGASKMVHHLAWAFDWGDPPRSYIMIYELTQWFGKARVYIDGIEVLLKRYSFLQQLSFSQDTYSIRVDRPELGALNGAVIQLRCAAHLGNSLLGLAAINGKHLPPPIYCERESLHSLHSSTNLVAKSEDSATTTQSPLSVLDARNSSTDSLTNMAASVAASAQAVRATAAPEVHAAAVQQLQASAHRASLTSIPEAISLQTLSSDSTKAVKVWPPAPPGAPAAAVQLPTAAAKTPQAISVRPPAPEGEAAADLAQSALPSPFSSVAIQRTDSSGAPWPMPSPSTPVSLWHSSATSTAASAAGASEDAGAGAHDSVVLLPGPAHAPAAPSEPAGGEAAPPQEASSSQPAPAAERGLAARIEAEVARQVEAQVGRLRAEFAKREAMLMQAVMSHAERERELVDRMAALERRLSQQQQQQQLAAASS